MLLNEEKLGRVWSDAFGVKIRIAVAHDALREDELTEGEMLRFAELRSAPRADAYLRGRRALRNLLAARGEDADTARLVFPHPRISLTHSRACAVAIAVESGARGVGVDLEFDRAVRDGASRFFLSEAERSFVAQRASETGDENSLLRLWTIKEALFKADPENGGKTLMNYSLLDPPSFDGMGRARDGKEFRYACVRFDGGFLSAAILPATNARARRRASR